MRRIILSADRPLLRGQTIPIEPEGHSIIDLSDLLFVTPFDLVGLAVSILSAPADASITVVPPKAPAVANYLQRMDLVRHIRERVRFEPLFPPELPRQGEPALIELRRYAHPDGFDEEFSALWPGLRSKLSHEDCQRLLKSVGELVDNAATHGLSAAGTFVAAQYYSGTTSGMPEGLWAAVGDAGVGILGSLRRNPTYSTLNTDCQAIELAVTNGVTASDDRRGFGLGDVLDETRPGSALIRSGYGRGWFVKTRSDREFRRSRDGLAHVRGTWVHVLLAHNQRS